MPKKKTALTIEERLQQALVPAEEQHYEVPENWVWVRLLSTFVNRTDSKKKIQQKFYLKTGDYAIVDQGQNLIGGYTNDASLQYDGELPVVVFGDHTRCVKYVDFKFVQGADGVKILLPFKSFDSKFFYYAIMNLNIPNMGYRRHFPLFDKLTLPLPPLSEQQRIVERIEELFAKLDEAKERLQEVAESFAVRKAAILHKAFTGKLTKQWRRENGVSDESWEEKKGEDFFEYVTSGSRGWAKYYSDKGSIFVRMGNLNHGTIELDFSDIQYVELPDQVEGQRSKLQKNDILISITADVGMIGLVREDMDAYINQHVALARPKNDLYAEFLAWYFVSDVGLQQMQNKQRGATKIGLGLQDIRSIILKIPTLSEQHEIVRLIDDLLARERAAQQATEQALASIDLMKKSILARAFRGELGTNKASEASALELLKQVLAEN